MNDVSCQLKRSDKQKKRRDGNVWRFAYGDKRMNVIYTCDVRIREGYGYCI